MRQLTDEKSATDWDPMWSPDGTRIAFASRRSGNADIWMINADGTHLVQLTSDPTEDYAPTWSPDGTKIAFTSKRTGAHEVWILDLNGL
jgi:TolB protein